jgi:surface protein
MSAVTVMYRMFFNATSFNQDIGTWNTSAATDMGGVFYNATSFDQDISNWNVTAVSSYSSFDGATTPASWTTVEKPTFNPTAITSNAVFDTAVALWFSDEASCRTTYGPPGAWDVSNVTDMEEAFRNKSTFNEDLSNWDVSNVTSMKWMFQHAYDFASGGSSLSGWDTGNVTNMQNLFWNCQYFCYDLSGWDVANVTVCSNFNGGNCCSSITVPNFTSCTI